MSRRSAPSAVRQQLQQQPQGQLGQQQLPQLQQARQRLGSSGLPWRGVASESSARSSGNGRSSSEKRLSPPLTAAGLTALRKQHAVSPNENLAEDEDCPICMRSLRPGPNSCKVDPGSNMNVIVRLPCGGDHLFHWQCVQPWLSRCRLCPTCRREVQITCREASSGPGLRPRPTRTTFLDRPALEARLERAMAEGEDAMFQHRDQEDMLLRLRAASFR
eukprot:TRINITY_DN51959_c0_g1_i1.p1 TRINITY_DN51959_c0_g1~~TRINITY_DN51959_c0_g1_i1.p1  ORF type:complete len:218 (-),score=31.09 TRINITY_DN51959_c0_g1_i1:224-877(-)